MLLDYLERLRREPKSVRVTATYIISISLTAMVAFVWLIAKSVAPSAESTASAPKGVEAIRERFETLVPAETREEEPAPRQSIEEILRSRARGGAQGEPRATDSAPLVAPPTSDVSAFEPSPSDQPIVPHSTGTLETEGISW